MNAMKLEIDPTMPPDEVHLYHEGQLVGKITNLAVRVVSYQPADARETRIAHCVWNYLAIRDPDALATWFHIAMKDLLASQQGERVDEFWLMLSELAHAKDVVAQGPNKPMTRRSLHDVTLTMHEILLAKSAYIASLTPEADTPTVPEVSQTAKAPIGAKVSANGN